MIEVIIILYLLAFAFCVWLVFLFVNMAKDTKAIKRTVADKGMSATAPEISLKEVNLAILLNKKEEAYDRIITAIYNSYCSRCVETNGIMVENLGNGKKYQGLIEKATEYCYKLGYDIPEELKSIDAFLKFYNGNE